MSFETAIKWLVFYGIFGGGVLALIVWTVIKADDPARMVFKWLLTALVIWFMVAKVAPIVGAGGFAAAFGGIPLTAACGFVLAIIWRHHLIDLVANPIASLYDGGSTPPEPAPAYSVAQARQKAGKYEEAIQEIQKQLQMFPQDLEGHMLLASIQAEDLKDIEAAEQTLMHFCSQPGHAPRALVYALYALADWHLSNKDADSARRALERVIELLPGTEFELGAAQRIAHLGDPAAMAAYASSNLQLRAGIDNVGLLKDMTGGREKDVAPEQLAAEYVRHLEKYPLDNEVREKLAVVYVDHYKRLDLATAELEQIICAPKQRSRVVTQCLTLLADLQKKAGSDYGEIRATLERIIAFDPHCAAAEVARRRIDLLKLELKGNAAQAALKIGNYEQDIGLKGSRANNQRS